MQPTTDTKIESPCGGTAQGEQCTGLNSVAHPMLEKASRLFSQEKNDFISAIGLSFLLSEPELTPQS